MSEVGTGDTLDLELSPPVMVKGACFEVLHLKEPRAQQVRAAEKKLDANMSEASVTEYQMELVRLVAEVPPAVVEGLTVRQLYAAYGFVSGFITDPYQGLDAETAEPDAMDIELDPPLSWNGAQVSSLSLREPTAEELRRARGQMRSG